jgi:hypothetical protein
MAKYCPECGKKVNPTDKFCKSCGTSLIEPVKVQKKEPRPEKPPAPVLIPQKSMEPSKMKREIWIIVTVVIVVVIVGLFLIGYFKKAPQEAISKEIPEEALVPSVSIESAECRLKEKVGLASVYTLEISGSATGTSPSYLDVYYVKPGEPIEEGIYFLYINCSDWSSPSKISCECENLSTSQTTKWKATDDYYPLPGEEKLVIVARVSPLEGKKVYVTKNLTCPLNI